MSNFNDFGTITADGSSDVVSCRGWTTLSAHLDAGTGTWTWEFKGADGVWRSIYGGSDNVTLQAYTGTNMVNVFFGSDVAVRGTASSSSGVTWDWQIMGNLNNRHS